MLSTQQLSFLIILVLAFSFLVTERIRNDVVAVLVVLALAITRVLSPAEALSGFGSEPAMATRSRAAAIWLFSAPRAGLTSPAPRATDCGSFQSTVIACAATGRNAATTIKKCLKQTSNETHDQRGDACAGDQIRRTERTDRRSAVREGGDSERGAARWNIGGARAMQSTNSA